MPSSNAIIILAAGASGRLGSPKQLLPFGDKTLLQQVAETAFNAKIGNVYIVLGSETKKIKNELNIKQVHFIENTEWEEGIASSIRFGLKEVLKKEPGTETILFMVCDQPFITSTVLNEMMVARKQTGKPIVACSYADTLGTPALFDKSCFSELLKLNGDKGAGKIIQQNREAAATVAFPGGEKDIDTKEDYDLLKASIKNK